jgi:hypothetical protein
MIKYFHPEDGREAQHQRDLEDGLEQAAIFRRVD